MQGFCHRHRDQGVAEGRHERPELPDALRIGAPASADVDGAPHLQHVPTVEGAWHLDVADGEAELGDRALRFHDLARAGIRSWASDHGRVAEEHHGVFHKHGVGLRGRDRHLHDVPARVREQRNVFVPLGVSEFEIDGHPLEVSELAIGQRVCRGPYDRDPTRAGIRFAAHEASPDGVAGGNRADDRREHEWQVRPPEGGEQLDDVIPAERRSAADHGDSRADQCASDTRNDAADETQVPVAVEADNREDGKQREDHKG